MKTKIKLVALVVGLVSLLPMTSAWAGGGGSTTTYYAALKASVSNTGGGKVYAGTSKSAGTYATTSTSANQSSTTQDEGKTFYAFAQADTGFEFAGWSNTDGGTVVSTDNPYSVSVKCSSSSSDSPTTTTVWANFKKQLLAAFGITFETSDAGTYTVDGVAPVNKTGLTEATTVKLATSDPSFLNWRVNGSTVNVNPYDLTCTAATTVSAEFLTADQVTEAATYDELTAALANDGKKKITIPAGVDIVIAKGASVTVPSGKQLVVNGSLAVVGTLTNSGAISGNGKIYKISKKITQGEVITPVNGAGGKYTSWKYRNTTVETISPSLTGVDGFGSVVWGVLYNDNKVAQMSQQSPKAIKVSIGTDSINTISSIADNADKNEVATSDNFVLFADCNLTGPILEKSSTDKRLNFTGWIDCAGKKITHSVGRTNSSFHSRILNGTVSFEPGTDYQNATATFVNCGSITVKNIKGTCPMHFYDCGTEAKPTSFTFKYNSSPGTRKNYFYSGYYTYSFSTGTDNGNTEVRGGSFTTDPTSWLQDVKDADGEDASLKVVGPQNNLYKVVAKPKTKDLAEANGKVYQSLQAAVDEISANTPTTLKLKENVVLEEALVISAGKCVTIELDGRDISGGSIVNSGTLRIEDNSNQAEKGVLSSPVVNNGNGTIDLTYGQYACKFTLNGGTLTTHGGTFTSAFSYEEKGGTANLRGGTYNCAITVPEGHELVGSILGETCKGVIICDNPLSSAEVSYTVRGLDPEDHGLGVSDFDLYSNYKHSKSGWMTRSDFAGREAMWDRLAELKCTVEPVESKAFEATMSFDRPVKADSISGVASLAGRTETMALEDDIAAGEDYHVFIPMVTGAGYTAISYKNMFNGEENDRWAKLMCGIKNNDSLENIGTTMTFKYQLRTQTRAADYQSTNPKYDYSFTTYASATYKFTGKGAIYGETDYTSLAEAIEKVAEGGTIRLSKDCGESVTVGKEVSFTLDTNNFEFTGTIKGEVEKGFYVKRNGEVWTIFKKATETPVEIKAEDGDTSVAAVEVEDAWAEEVVQGSGVENPSDEQKQEIVQEALRQTEANGLKVWENKVLEQAEAKQTVTETGFAKVSKTEVTVDDKVVTATSVKEEIAGSANLADQETGTYQATVIVPDAKGVKVAIADTKATAKSVIKNDSAEKTVVLAIPNDVTVATAIATVPQENDQIKVYDTDKQGYRCWEFKNSKWTPINTETENGNIQNDMDATNEVLRAGSVILYEHSKVSVGQKVSVVTDYKKDVASEPAEVPTKTDGSDPKWNLMANPTGEDFELNKIIENETADNKTAELDKIVVLPKSGLGQKTYEKGSDNKWGYYKTEETQVKGRWVSKRVWIGSEDEKPVVPKGQSMWYISNGGRPKIEWNK